MTPLQLLRKAKDMEVPLTVAVDARKRYLRDQYRYFSQTENGGWYAPYRMGEIKDEAATLDKLATKSPVLDSLSESDIAEAKAIPITSIQPVDRLGKARNSCPNDVDHSVDVLSRSNKLKCYVCDESWDTIDWVIKSMGMNFTGAVRYLIGR